MVRPVNLFPRYSMSNQSKETDRLRRRLLIQATAAVGVAGIGTAAWPFIASWLPSARARAYGAPVEIDVSRIEPGAQVTVLWRGHPVWVLHRTPEILRILTEAALLARLRDPDSQELSQQPAYAHNPLRSIQPQLLVVLAVCTHLGCVPLFRPDIGPPDLGAAWRGGYFCPCHGSQFDFAGRVFKNVPAPTNLVVPPHRYLTPTVLQIGQDQAA